MEQVYDCLSTYHEVEFSYNGIRYSIEPCEEGDSISLTIWECGDKPDCIASSQVVESKCAKTAIDELFHIRCFDGKSFVDIEQAVTIEIMY